MSELLDILRGVRDYLRVQVDEATCCDECEPWTWDRPAVDLLRRVEDEIANWKTWSDD